MQPDDNLGIQAWDGTKTKTYNVASGESANDALSELADLIINDGSLSGWYKNISEDGSVILGSPINHPVLHNLTSDHPAGANPQIITNLAHSGISALLDVEVDDILSITVVDSDNVNTAIDVTYTVLLTDTVDSALEGLAQNLQTAVDAPTPFQAKFDNNYTFDPYRPGKDSYQGSKLFRTFIKSFNRLSINASSTRCWFR